MTLEHYSYHSLSWPPRDFEQERGHRDISLFKPRGLWVSVRGEDDWPSWVRSDWEDRVSSLRVCTRVILSPDANLKIITNEPEIITFDEEYGESLKLSYRYERHTIDWARLAVDYDGIVIAPYIWSCRLPMEWPKQARGKVSDWYYPWDCASGCIWNGTKAIAGFAVTEGAALAAE